MTVQSLMNDTLNRVRRNTKPSTEYLMPNAPFSHARGTFPFHDPDCLITRLVAFLLQTCH